MKRILVNKSPYLTRTKKKKQEESDDPFSLLPLDLKSEILLKQPAKSVTKLNFVSNRFSSIIRGKDFTDLYLPQSSTRPRLLFTLLRHDVKYFLSCSQEDPSSDHHKVNISVMAPDDDDWCEFSPPIRGLICAHNQTKALIGNPSTGQFLTLPRVKTTRGSIYTFFGYDTVNDEYKVLCMTVKNVYPLYGPRVVSKDHQVFTLGGKNQEWRRIKCKHPHRPRCGTKGLCVNGVLYYYDWIKSLISFDLMSEEFNVIKLPEDIRLVDGFTNLVNYSGKIGVSLESVDFNGTFDLRVLEDASKQEWSKVSIVVPSWEDLAGDDEFCLKGALSTGELIFATESFINPFYIISYNIKENNAKRVVIGEIGDNLTAIEVFFDHVDSPMYLSNVS